MNDAQIFCSRSLKNSEKTQKQVIHTQEERKTLLTFNFG